MAENEDFVTSTLMMDRGIPLGNSVDTFNRRAVHTKIGNTPSEPIPVSGSFAPAVNTGGAIQNQTVTTTASTFFAPANAVGFVLESDSTNSDSIRWAIGSTATSMVGMLAEPGRDTGYIPVAKDISVIALAGSQGVSVQWVLSS